jgi:hypothetical protein
VSRYLLDFVESRSSNKLTDIGSIFLKFSATLMRERWDRITKTTSVEVIQLEFEDSAAFFPV